MVSEAVRDLDAGGVLDAVQAWHASQVESEVAIFVAAAHFADLHHPDSRPGAGGPVLAGTEQARRLGGAGTPLVFEFAVAELGARLGRSPRGLRRWSPTPWTCATACRDCGRGCVPGRCGWPTPGMWPRRPVSCPNRPPRPSTPAWPSTPTAG